MKEHEAWKSLEASVTGASKRVKMPKHKAVVGWEQSHQAGGLV